MSRAARIHFAPALALVALATAGLIRPGVGFAQSVTPEQALLNRTDAAYVPVVVITDPYAPVAPEGDQIGGDRALLGRTTTFPSPVEVLLGIAPLDGERALLGRWPVARPSRPGILVLRSNHEEADRSE